MQQLRMRTLRDGDMSLLAIRAEFHFYAFDITCSFPIGRENCSLDTEKGSLLVGDVDEMMVERLVFSCHMDWAWESIPTTLVATQRELNDTENKDSWMEWLSRLNLDAISLIHC